MEGKSCGRVSEAFEHTEVRPTARRMAISDIQREADPELDQGLARRLRSSGRTEHCSWPRQGEGAGVGETGVVAGSMGLFREASLSVERMISISGCFFTNKGDCTGLVVMYRIAFVCSKGPHAEATR